VDIERALATLPVPARLHTRRTSGYFKWRYAASPLPYWILDRNDRTAVCRLRLRGSLRELVVTDVLGPDHRGVADLLASAGREADADHIVIGLPEDQPGGPALRGGFWIRLRGPVFVVRTLAASASERADPTDRDAWSLSLGDLELF
jgi:hypothetical protein